MTAFPYAAWTTAGLDAWSLALEASAVIGLRLAMLARGGAEAEREAQLMVSEKLLAALKLQTDLVTGRLGSTPLSATQGVLQHYGGKVRANRRRLG